MDRQNLLSSGGKGRIVDGSMTERAKSPGNENLALQEEGRRNNRVVETLQRWEMQGLIYADYLYFCGRPNPSFRFGLGSKPMFLGHCRA